MKFNKPWPKLDLVCRGWDAHIYLILGMGEGASASANDEPGIQNPYNKERRFFIASMILRWRVCYGTFFSETLEEWNHLLRELNWTELKFGTKRSFLVKLVWFLKYRCSGVHVGILMLMSQKGTHCKLYMGSHAFLQSTFYTTSRVCSVLSSETLEEWNHLLHERHWN